MPLGEVSWDVKGAAIIKNDRNTAEYARRFLDWALEQTILPSSKIGLPPLTSEAKRKLAAIGINLRDVQKNSVPYDLEYAATMREEILGRWQARYGYMTYKK